MFKYVIYGRARTADTIDLAGTNDLADATQILLNHYASGNKIYYAGTSEVVSFGILDKETNEEIELF